MIQRWDIDSETIGNKNALIPSAEGDWVEYSDHIGIVNELIEALKRITSGMVIDLWGETWPLEIRDMQGIATEAIKKARGE